MEDPQDSEPQSPPPPASSRIALVLASLGLVLAAAALLAIVRGGMVITDLRVQLDDLRATHAASERTHDRLARSVDVLGNAVTLLSDEQIDLSNPKLQQLRHGFAVSEIALERRDSGVSVVGRVINGSSLSYRDATFRLKVESTSKQFAIASLPPGSSGPFELVLPNLPLEKARTATLSLVSSAVEYSR